MDARLRRWQHGASLLETLIAATVAVVVVGLGAPRIVDVVQSSRLTAAANALLADLYLARSEAIRRNRRVALCKSGDGAQCVAAGGWEQGWVVFHDENNNGLVDPAEEVIRRHEPLPADLRVTGNQPIAKYISYGALGASKLTGGAFQAGTLTACRRSAEATPARQVIVNSVGRPRVQRSTVAICG